MIRNLRVPMKCEQDVYCQRPAEFVRTVEPPRDTTAKKFYCSLHAHAILASDPNQMAELLLDIIRQSNPA
jgi:hypothetical protein